MKKRERERNIACTTWINSKLERHLRSSLQTSSIRLNKPTFYSSSKVTWPQLDEITKWWFGELLFLLCQRDVVVVCEIVQSSGTAVSLKYTHALLTKKWEASNSQTSQPWFTSPRYIMCMYIWRRLYRQLGWVWRNAKRAADYSTVHNGLDPTLELTDSPKNSFA